MADTAITAKQFKVWADKQDEGVPHLSLWCSGREEATPLPM